MHDSQNARPYTPSIAFCLKSALHERQVAGRLACVRASSSYVPSLFKNVTG